MPAKEFFQAAINMKLWRTDAWGRGRRFPVPTFPKKGFDSNGRPLIPQKILGIYKRGNHDLFHVKYSKVAGMAHQDSGLDRGLAAITVPIPAFDASMGLDNSSIKERQCDLSPCWPDF